MSLGSPGTLGPQFEELAREKEREREHDLEVAVLAAEARDRPAAAGHRWSLAARLRRRIGRGKAR